MSVQRYLARISGPLLDRMDIHLSVPPVAYADLADRTPAESSALIRLRVEAARQRQPERFREVPGLYVNAHMGQRDIARHVRLISDMEAVLWRAIVKLATRYTWRAMP